MKTAEDAEDTEVFRGKASYFGLQGRLSQH